MSLRHQNLTNQFHNIFRVTKNGFINIGIKHDFLCINFCLAPREVLQPEPERRGFQHLLRGPADVNVS